MRASTACWFGTGRPHEAEPPKIIGVPRHRETGLTPPNIMMALNQKKALGDMCFVRISSARIKIAAVETIDR